MYVLIVCNLKYQARILSVHRGSCREGSRPGEGLTSICPRVGSLGLGGRSVPSALVASVIAMLDDVGGLRQH